MKSKSFVGCVSVFAVTAGAYVASGQLPVDDEKCASSCAEKPACTQSESGVVVQTVAFTQPDGAKAATTRDIVDTAVSAGSFKTLATALAAADLVTALKGKGPFTVFAPTDDAFKKLGTETLTTLLKPENQDRLKAILMYHVVPGTVKAADVVKVKNAVTLNGQRVDVEVKGAEVMIDKAKVTKTDIACTNGVIHVIDTVILPSEKSVVQVAKDAKFTTLATLLDKAGLAMPLSSGGPYTVFAPTDEAFAKLDKATLESLQKPENREKLASILKFHVVAGPRIYSTDAVKAGSAKSMQGGTLTIKASGDKVMVQNATITGTDVDAANGVIHIIDTVLMPK